MNLLKETKFTWISPRVYTGKTSPPTLSISLSQVTLWITTFSPHETRNSIRYLRKSFYFITYI